MENLTAESAKERKEEKKYVVICSPILAEYYKKLKASPFIMSEEESKSYGLNLTKVKFKEDGNT